MKLEERDKKALIIGGAAAVCILLYVFALAPVTADLSRKRDLIPKKERDLAEIRVLREQYLEIQRQLQEAQAAAAKRGPLLTEIENTTKRANLSSKLVSLKPHARIQTETFMEGSGALRLGNVALYDGVNLV